MPGLIARHHQDGDAARAYLEAKLWPAPCVPIAASSAKRFV